MRKTFASEYRFSVACQDARSVAEAAIAHLITFLKMACVVALESLFGLVALVAIHFADKLGS